MSDLRSPLAKARDAFLERDEGKKLLEGSASGQYLKNRIEAAWLAGVRYGMVLHDPDTCGGNE